MTNINKNGEDEKDNEVDIWRKTWVRFLGYSNEVGEAFNWLIHSTSQLLILSFRA